jgi:hypothetical protein
MKQILKDFITECLLFGKPFSGYVPNFLIGLVAWIDIAIIVNCIQIILTK